MTSHHTIARLLLVLFLLEAALSGTPATAERLPESDLGSNLPMNCDLCWTPQTDKADPSRLPTVKPRRPRRSLHTRPHRIPPGGYRLAPRKPSSSLFRPSSRFRQASELISIHQITVIDGDTIRIGTERIRLRGIDAPELNEPNGWASTQRLKDLLGTGSIQLIPRGRDVYDRVVADVFVNGQNVADILKHEGWAKSR